MVRGAHHAVWPATLAPPQERGHARALRDLNFRPGKKGTSRREKKIKNKKKARLAEVLADVSPHGVDGRIGALSPRDFCHLAAQLLR